MPRHKFTHDAEEDLREIVEYSLASWGGPQTIRYIEGLESLAERLAANPKIGINRSALLEGVLSFSYQSHTLFYLEEPFGITILRVLHQRMDVQRHLGPDPASSSGKAPTRQ